MSDSASPFSPNYGLFFLIHIIEPYCKISEKERKEFFTTTF